MCTTNINYSTWPLIRHSIYHNLGLLYDVNTDTQHNYLTQFIMLNKQQQAKSSINPISQVKQTDDMINES